MGSGGDIRQRTYSVATCLFLLTAGFVAIRTGRDALYFQEDGLFELPKAFIAIAVLSVPQAMLVLWALARIGARRTRLVALVGVAGAVVAFYPLAEPGGSPVMTGFFVLVPLVFSIVFSLTWLLGTELFSEASSEDAAYAFSRLGAASILGGVAGGAFARAIGPGSGPENLLLWGAGLVVCAALGAARVHRRYPSAKVHTPSQSPSLGGTTWAVLRVPRAILLLAMAMAAALCAILIDFQFYLTAFENAGTSSSNTVFFANVYMLLNGISLLLQLIIAPRLQRWVGVGGSLMVLPGVLAAGAAAVLLSASGAVRAGLRIAEGGLKAGVHRSVWEQSFLVFGEDVRPSAKVLIDGLGARIAEGAAAGLLMLWLAMAMTESGALVAGSTVWVAGALLGAAVLWAVLSLALRRALERAPAETAAEPPLTDDRWRAPLPDF